MFVFLFFFFFKAVKSYLFCLLSAYNIALIFFFWFSPFFGRYWTRWRSSAAPHWRFHCLQRGGRGGGAHQTWPTPIASCLDHTPPPHPKPPTPRHMQLAPQQQQDRLCKECASVHKISLCNLFFVLFFLVSVSWRCSWTFFFYYYYFNFRNLGDFFQPTRRRNSSDYTPSVWL